MGISRYSLLYELASSQESFETGGINYDSKNTVLTRQNHTNDIYGDIGNFYQRYDNFNKIINSKEEMLKTISDIVEKCNKAQIKKIDKKLEGVRKELIDIGNQQDKIEIDGKRLLVTYKDTPIGEEIAEKISNIQVNFDNLVTQLEDIEWSLSSMPGVRREFTETHNKLSNKLSSKIRQIQKHNNGRRSNS